MNFDEILKDRMLKFFAWKKKRLYTEWKNKFFAVPFYVTFYHQTFPTAVTDIETYQNGCYSDDHLFLSSVTFV